jgi:hypothetical protein
MATSGGLPPLRQTAPSLSDDQLAGKMKALKLKDTYGPNQDERDRIERSNLAKEGKSTPDEPTSYMSPDGRTGGMGPLKKMAKGGSASKRADGCCAKGKTKGRFV